MMLQIVDYCGGIDQLKEGLDRRDLTFRFLARSPNGFRNEFADDFRVSFRTAGDASSLVHCPGNHDCGVLSL